MGSHEELSVMGMLDKRLVQARENLYLEEHFVNNLSIAVFRFEIERIIGLVVPCFVKWVAKKSGIIKKI